MGANGTNQKNACGRAREKKNRDGKTIHEMKRGQSGTPDGDHGANTNLQMTTNAQSGDIKTWPDDARIGRVSLSHLTTPLNSEFVDQSKMPKWSVWLKKFEIWESAKGKDYHWDGSYRMGLGTEFWFIGCRFDYRKT
jgi:hypothetical protein